jgi:hypothetical protein
VRQPVRMHAVPAQVRRLRIVWARLAEDCARQELKLEEHSQALQGTILDVLGICCRDCSLSESDRLAVERVMLIPTWVGVGDFFSTMEVYRQTALRIRRHRVCLRREIGLRRRLCGLTGRRAELESWRAMFALGDTEMEPPE